MPQKNMTRPHSWSMGNSRSSGQALTWACTGNRRASWSAPYVHGWRFSSGDQYRAQQHRREMSAALVSWKCQEWRSAITYPTTSLTKGTVGEHLCRPSNSPSHFYFSCLSADTTSCPLSHPKHRCPTNTWPGPTTATPWTQQFLSPL